MVMPSKPASIDYEEQIIAEVQATPTEYRLALLEIIRLFRQSVTLPSAEISFRQGWQEMALGETKPVYELWEDIDAE
jgi:hypothetical protein